MLANGIVARPETLRELFVDNRHLLAVDGVVIVEIAALQQGNLHGAKVIRAGRPQVYLQFLARRRSVALHVDAAPSYPAGERQWRHQALRHHSGQMADAIADFAIELGDRFAIAILRAVGRHLHRKHVIGRESRRHVLKPHKAADQQSRAYQKHQ